jgi:beta-phosphoglucomutase-like phosphatase (HAD superfamily)
MHPPIRALFFDFDGLIFDTETTEMIVWKNIYAEYGFEYPEDRWARNAGLWGDQHRWDSAAHLQGLLQRPLDLPALKKRHHDESAAAFLTQPACDGVVQYLDDAQRLGLRLAVASSSPLYWVSGHLTRLGLVDRFERIISGDDVTPERVKPQPDIYLKALEVMQVAPGETIALEDSPHGLLAAHAAGIFAVAVPNPTTARLELPAADLVIDSLADVPLEQLLQRVTEAAPPS